MDELEQFIHNLRNDDESQPPNQQQITNRARMLGAAISFIESDENIADAFSKAHPADQFADAIVDMAETFHAYVFDDNKETA